MTKKITWQYWNASLLWYVMVIMLVHGCSTWKNTYAFAETLSFLGSHIFWINLRPHNLLSHLPRHRCLSRSIWGNTVGVYETFPELSEEPPGGDVCCHQGIFWKGIRRSLFCPGYACNIYDIYTWLCMYIYMFAVMYIYIYIHIFDRRIITSSNIHASMNILRGFLFCKDSPNGSMSRDSKPTPSYTFPNRTYSNSAVTVAYSSTPLKTKKTSVRVLAHFHFHIFQQ